jgi:hypothetical protein
MGHLSFNLFFLKIKIDPNQTDKIIKPKPISKASYEDFLLRAEHLVRAMHRSYNLFYDRTTGVLE